MLPPTTFILLFLSCARLIVCYGPLYARAACSSSYTACNPEGAATTNEPPVGTALASLFVDVVDTLNSANLAKRDAERARALIESRASGGSLCCVDGTICLLLRDLDLPFCYDNYTTNFFLPGGAYGQVHDGSYTDGGSNANLLTGNYTLGDGSSGNIYGTPATTPDTATLRLPTQYTAAGAGSAIPVTALGQFITYTTTFPGTTIPPSVISAATSVSTVIGGSDVPILLTEAVTSVISTTMPASSVMGGSTIETNVPEAVTSLVSTTTSGSTVLGGSTVPTVMTEPVTTIPGTTIEGRTSTITSQIAPSATKKGSGCVLSPNGSVFVSLFVLGLTLGGILC